MERGAGLCAHAHCLTAGWGMDCSLSSSSLQLLLLFPGGVIAQLLPPQLPDDSPALRRVKRERWLETHKYTHRHMWASNSFLMFKSVAMRKISPILAFSHFFSHLSLKVLNAWFYLRNDSRGFNNILLEKSGWLMRKTKITTEFMCVGDQTHTLFLPIKSGLIVSGCALIFTVTSDLPRCLICGKGEPLNTNCEVASHLSTPHV